MPTLTGVLTRDGDFGTLAIHAGEPVTGIVYLRPGHISALFCSTC
jgi:predicted nuclease of predicted toxin-antitoxin system